MDSKARLLNGGGTGSRELVASEACGTKSGAGIVLEEGNEFASLRVAGLVLRSLRNPAPYVKLVMRRVEFVLALRALLLSCILFSSRSCMRGSDALKYKELSVSSEE